MIQKCTLVIISRRRKTQGKFLCWIKQEQKQNSKLCVLYKISNVLSQPQPLTGAGSASWEFLNSPLWCAIITFLNFNDSPLLLKTSVMSLCFCPVSAHRSGPAMRNHPERWEWLRAHRQRRQPRVCAARQRRWGKKTIEEQREATFLQPPCAYDGIRHVVYCQLGCKRKRQQHLGILFEKKCWHDNISFRCYSCSVPVSSLYFFYLLNWSHAVTVSLLFNSHPKTANETPHCLNYGWQQWVMYWFIID